MGQGRVVEVPQVQVVQPVINEQIVETVHRDVSYQTSVHAGAPVTRVASHGLVGGVVSGAVATTGVVSAPVATTGVISGGVVGGYGGSIVGGGIATATPVVGGIGSFVM